MRRLRSAEADSRLCALRFSLMYGTGILFYKLSLLQYSQTLSRVTCMHHGGTSKPHYLWHSDIIAATIADISLFFICLGIARIVFETLWTQCVGWNIDVLYPQRQCAVERVPDPAASVLHYQSLYYLFGYVV